MTEQVITEDQSGHGLDHGNGPGKNTGIMPPATLQFCVRASVADGCLFGHNSRCWFEGDPEQDGLSVRDASLNTAGVIRVSPHTAVLHVEVIVVFLSCE